MLFCFVFCIWLLLPFVFNTLFFFGFFWGGGHVNLQVKLAPFLFTEQRNRRVPSGASKAERRVTEPHTSRMLATLTWSTKVYMAMDFNNEPPPKQLEATNISPPKWCPPQGALLKFTPIHVGFTTPGKKQLSSISKVGPGWRASCGVHSGLAPLPWNQPGRYPKLVDVWAHVDKAGKEAGHSVLVKTGDHTPQSKDTTGKGRKRRSRIRTKDGFGRAFVHALSCGFSAGNEGTNSRTQPSGFTPSWTCVPLLGWRRLRGKPIGTHRFAARLRLGAEKSRPRQDPKPHPRFGDQIRKACGVRKVGVRICPVGPTGYTEKEPIFGFRMK